jgi:amidase
MYTIPDVDEVVAVAAGLGITLSSDEAAIYQKRLAENLAAQDAFVQSRIEEDKPPMLSPSREPGYRPSSEEDPLNAWTWKCHIEGLPGGILDGKTVSTKDQIAIAGIPMSIGAFALEGFIPDFDATVVTRVLAAGATVVGHNTQNGLSGGFGFGGGIGDYGRPKNPHNPDHLTGGSSAGSGAAVAAGEVDISFGGDQGGSIRIPAALSGNVGLKPTFGLISHFGIGFGSDQSIDYTGPMARTVEDAAAALQATAGYDGYDPRQTKEVPDTLDVLTGLSRGVSGLKIGLLDEGFLGADPGVADLVMSAVETLSSVGAQVSKVSVPEHLTARDAQQALGPEGGRAVFMTGFYGAFTRSYYPASLLATINKLWAHQADLLNPRTKLSLIEAEFLRKTYYGRVYAKAQNVRPYFIKAFDKVLADLDVLVMPTCLDPAPLYEAPPTYMEALEDNLNSSARNASRNTQPYNYTGHPALAVPVGKINGLPASMQLVGKFFDDALLLQVAYAYEHSIDWDKIISVEA